MSNRMTHDGQDMAVYETAHGLELENVPHMSELTCHPECSAAFEEWRTEQRQVCVCEDQRVAHRQGPVGSGIVEACLVCPCEQFVAADAEERLLGDVLGPRCGQCGELEHRHTPAQAFGDCTGFVPMLQVPPDTADAEDCLLSDMEAVGQETIAAYMDAKALLPPDREPLRRWAGDIQGALGRGVSCVERANYDGLPPGYAVLLATARWAIEALDAMPQEERR